jgi:hypothetical protein
LDDGDRGVTNVKRLIILLERESQLEILNLLGFIDTEKKADVEFRTLVCGGVDLQNPQTVEDVEIT